MRRGSAEGMDQGPTNDYPVPVNSTGLEGILTAQTPHYEHNEPVSNHDQINEVLAVKFEQLSLLTGEIAEILGRMGGPFRSRLNSMRGVRASPYEHYAPGSSPGALPASPGVANPMASQVALAEALRLHDSLTAHKNPKTGKVDGRRVASPMLVRWVPNNTNKEIEVKGSTWSRENLGMVVSYYNPIVDREVHRNFSSRRYKGRSKCEDAAKEFYEHLKQGYLPDDDDAYMNAQMALAQGGRRDRPKVEKADGAMPVGADPSPILLASKAGGNNKWETVGAAAASVKDDEKTLDESSRGDTDGLLDDGTESAHSENDE